MATAIDQRAVAPHPGLRNATLAFRRALSDMCRLPGYRGRARNDALTDLGFCLRRFKCDGADPEDVLDGLIEDGIVADLKGRIIPAARAVRRSKEERQAAFDGWVAAVSERATEDVHARTLLASLIRRMTRLHGVHRVSTPHGDGIMLASRMGFVSWHPAITEATVIVIGRNGIDAYKAVDMSRISCSWENEWPHFAVDIEGLKPDRRENEMMMHMRLVGTQQLHGLHSIVGESSRAVRKLVSHREDIEAFIGLTLKGARWNGLRMSLNGAKSLVQMARKALLGMLDPEIRRIALRHPYADFAFYYWLKRGSATTVQRRMQMSDAFPSMTYRMKDLDEVIRTGQPLLPALQKLTGMDMPRIRRLRGIHWQRLGYGLRSLIPDDPFEGINQALKKIPSQRFPEGRKDWEAFSDVTHWEVLTWLPEQEARSLLDAASRNWIGYAELVGADFGQAVSDCAENLLSLIDLHVSSSSRIESAKTSMRRKIIEQVAGGSYGLKRLRQFSDAWHKGAGQRAISMRAVRRSVFGEERIATWHALTPGDFSCATGRLVWMTDEDQLVLEGRQMSHCVGSYWSSCVQGVSHIGQVHGFDGTRSTVEFALSDRGRLSTRQHHAYRNGDPSQACKGVVSKFLSENRKNTFPIVTGDAGTHHRGARREMISPEVAAAIRAAYEDCLPAAFMDHLEAQGRQWRSVNPGISVDAAEAARMARENRASHAPAALPRAVDADDDEFG